MEVQKVITLESPISDLPLPTTTKNRIAHEYIDNVRQLCGYSRNDLIKAGFGKSVIDRIEECLQQFGLELSRVDQTQLPPKSSDIPAHSGGKGDPAFYGSSDPYPYRMQGRTTNPKGYRRH